MKNKIFLLEISLLDCKPSIWRKVMVPADIQLEDLHKVIQSTMGWSNSHLHQFIQGGIFYLPGHSVDTEWQEEDEIHYKGILLSALLSSENEKIYYEYDFGDGWVHEIVLEKILPVEKDTKYPICTSGEMDCPPEDCGGAGGYQEILKILKQPDHEEYDTYIEWMGEDYDPTHFDIKFVNELLSQKDYGCEDWDWD